VGLTEALSDAQERLRGVEDASSHLRDTEGLLATLNARLDEPLTFALKRELVEALVEAILIETIPQEGGGQRKLVATIRYRFTPLESESSFTVETPMSGVTSAISSRNKVPPSAASNSPP
jgi:hypothetical protein